MAFYIVQKTEQGEQYFTGRFTEAQDAVHPKRQAPVMSEKQEDALPYKTPSEAHMVIMSLSDIAGQIPGLDVSGKADS